MRPDSEGVGVKPDMEVDNQPNATFKGEDAQLDVTIGYLMEKMASVPMLVPTMLAFPVKAK